MRGEGEAAARPPHLPSGELGIQTPFEDKAILVVGHSILTLFSFRRVETIKIKAFIFIFLSFN